MVTAHKERVIVVDFTRRLPDVNSLDGIPADLDDFGRFAVLRNGALSFGDVHSTHPRDTQEGFYWAVSGDRLYISPCGSTYRWQAHITPSVIEWLIDKIGTFRRYRQFRIVA
jgi:hypothetical protein